MTTQTAQKVEWDYTVLADAYLKRPDYADKAIDEMLQIAGIQADNKVCDVGAGVAHLTIKLAERDLQVNAVEPNDAMRANGISRTQQFAKVAWSTGTGEVTGQPSDSFDLVTFGSSFNVTDRAKALSETARILRPGGWFACMWNHRHLDDPIQANIEAIIKSHIAGYGYGKRREDQTEVINESGLFHEVSKIEHQVLHQQSINDCVEAWRSHATLQRQAGDAFHPIINAISEYLDSLDTATITVPYTTRVWVAQLRD